MRKLPVTIAVFAVLLGMMFITASAGAASYGNFAANDFMFGNVQDSTSPDDGLYGPIGNITTNGNALEFSPTGFTATSVASPDPGSDGKTSVIQSLISKTGLEPINVIRIVETGTFAFTGDNGDWAEVQVSGELTLTRLSPSPAIFTNASFGESHMSLDVDEDGTFSFAVEIDVSSWNASMIQLSHSNFVQATTGSLGTTSTISKTGFSIIINPDEPIEDIPNGFEPNAIPLPAGVWAGLAGLAAALGLRRRFVR